MVLGKRARADRTQDEHGDGHADRHGLAVARAGDAHGRDVLQERPGPVPFALVVADEADVLEGVRELFGRERAVVVVPQVLAHRADQSHGLHDHAVVASRRASQLEKARPRGDALHAAEQVPEVPIPAVAELLALAEVAHEPIGTLELLGDGRDPDGRARERRIGRELHAERQVVVRDRRERRAHGAQERRRVACVDGLDQRRRVRGEVLLRRDGHGRTR
jgi:hypothetical protein